MAGVPGVLLDHVNEHVPRGHGAIAGRHLAAQVILLQRVEPLLRPGDLGLPGCEGVGDYGGVGERAREVPVRVVGPLVKARAVRLPLQYALEPLVFHLGQMTDQP